MKKLLLAVVAAIALFFGGRAVYRAWVSDETKIRWLIEDSAQAFNEEKAGRVIAAFDTSYRDDSANVDRETLRSALMYVLVRPGRGTRYRVEVAMDGVELEVREAEQRATAKLPVVLHEVGSDGYERRLWEVRIDAELCKTDEGWRFVRSRHETIAGGRPR